jgi:lipopolysaccharide/colanic/teichoic acid biosynthesis glycosyltransferase
MVKSGYSKVHLVANRIFNFTLAALFLLISSPVLLIISLLIKLQDGKEIFYRGARLGINKKTFIMYKFRTLVPDAEQVIGAELLSRKHKVVTRLGAILRDSRLDELPQLFNILKGDMDFIGPRPERPIIYEEVCSHIKSYDKRFSVAPGLIGFSQLFTPHSAPKEIRALIDNHFIRYKQSMLMELRLIMYTMLKVLGKSFQKLIEVVWVRIIQGAILGRSEKREMERVRLHKTSISLVTQNGSGIKSQCKLSLEDINDEAFLISSDRKLDFDKGLFRLESSRKSRGSNTSKKKSAYCKAELYKEVPHNDGNGYVFKYNPNSRLNAYMLHQYFLSKSIG